MGSRRKTQKNESLSSVVRKFDVLEAAWHVVRRNGSAPSASKTSKRDVLEFSERATRNLRSLQQRLSTNYQFLPQRGVVVSKSGSSKKAPKKHRPIVVAPIENRIVHRAILDVLVEHVPAVREVLEVDTSFGGIEGVESAIALVWRELKAGKHNYFIRSDIPSFFTRINKEAVVRFIAEAVRDDEFLALFRKALETSLENEDELGKNTELFPLGPTGVAQGSALSPLICNIVLKSFDREMNCRDIVCIRYIDDFLLLGPSKKKVEAAFESACRQLSALNLSAYDPEKSPDKAESGFVKDGFEFLGCRVHPGLVQPTLKKRTAAAERVEKILSESRGGIRAYTQGKKKSLAREHCYSSALNDVANFVRGWSHAYRFCNDEQVFRTLDDKISDSLRRYTEWTFGQIHGASLSVRRQVLGVPLLTDTPRVALDDVPARMRTIR